MRPQKLGPRAEALWDGVLNEVELDSAALSLLEDACRTVDIIDRLSGALRSKSQEWVRIDEEARAIADEHGCVEVHLVINPILGEIRQQRMTLKNLLAQLKLGNITPKAPQDEHKSLFEQLEAEFNS